MVTVSDLNMAPARFHTAVIVLAHFAAAEWPALKPAQPVRRMPTLGASRPRAAPRALDGATDDAAAKRSVDAQLLSIAAPALAGLCIDPLATLVDTVWAARLGTPELAALGAAGSLFALCAKTFNFVLPSTTSAVAAASAAAPASGLGLQAANATSFYSPAVLDVAYSSLLLALLIGLPLGLAMVRACVRASARWVTRARAQSASLSLRRLAPFIRAPACVVAPVWLPARQPACSPLSAALARALSTRPELPPLRARARVRPNQTH
jgi:hypothetical protein